MAIKFMSPGWQFIALTTKPRLLLNQAIIIKYKLSMKTHKNCCSSMAYLIPLASRLRTKHIKQCISTTYQQIQRFDCTSAQFPHVSQTMDSCYPGSISQELRDVLVETQIFLVAENWGHRTRRRWKPAQQNPELRDQGTSWEELDLRYLKHSAWVM